MNIINIIISEKGYADRFDFFLSLDPYVENQIIFTRAYTNNKYNLKNTIIRTPDKKNTGIRFWFWVAKEIGKILASTSKKWIVVEHLNGLSLCLLRLNFFRKKKRPKYVLALYSENFYYLFKKAWTLDKHSPKLSFHHQLSYYKNWTINCILELFYILFSDAVIANGPQVLQVVNRLFPSKPTYLIKNSIKLRKEKASEISKPKESPSIKLLFVGTFKPAKGIATLLYATKLLREKGVTTELTLVGRIRKDDRKWFLNLEKKYQELNPVIISEVGFDEIHNYYKACDFFIFPSFSEGSPRVILEALNSNCNIICSDIKSIRSIDPNEKMVKFFIPGNANDLCDKILQGKQGEKSLNKKILIQQILEKEHSAGPLAQKLINFYKSIENE